MTGLWPRGSTKMALPDGCRTRAISPYARERSRWWITAEPQTEVERAVGEVQGLGIHHEELDAVFELFFGRPPTPLLHRHGERCLSR